MKWTFFDLDDTLWDFSVNSLSALRGLYYGKQCLTDRFPSFDDFSEAYHILNDSLWKEYHAGLISAEFLKRERFLRLLNDTSAESVALAEKLNEEYLDRLCQGTELVPGAKALLEIVCRESLICLLSNGFLNTQYKKLRSEGIWRYVQRLIISEEIGIQKPDRRLFEYALSETGASLTDAVLIGDNPDADIAGAIRAGWKAIYFDRKGKPLPEDVAESDRLIRVTTLSEVPDALATLHSNR